VDTAGPRTLGPPRLRVTSRTQNDRTMKKATSHGDRGRSKPNPLDPKVQERIGRQLRAYYDDVVNQPMPQHLIDLIEQMDGAEDKK